jgi:hypothetical protein
LAKGDPIARVRAIANAAGISGEIDWPHVARVLKARRGNAADVGLARRATSSR